jgi:quinol monooxygenase YgiN
VTENAQASVRSEPGCRQFDVVLPRDARASVFLYEVYDSEPAFQGHMASAHYSEFDRLSAPIIVSKTVVVGGRYFAGQNG